MLRLQAPLCMAAQGRQIADLEMISGSTSPARPDMAAA
jgi:hypothetical protein